MRQVVVFIALLTPGLALAEGWQVARHDSDGLVVETREVSDSAFAEIRVRVHAAGTKPARLSDAVWAFNPAGTEGQLIEQRVVLSEAPGEQLVWEVVRPPLVSRREVTLRYTREAARGQWLVRFVSEDGAARARGTVRVRLVRGLWRFTDDGQGGSYVEHCIVSDPGGDVPAWLAAGAQQDLAVALVREAVANASR
jgi:hypothetical protein